MEIIEDRYKLCSTLIASQLPMSHWHDYVGESTIADAILDWPFLEGESIRKKINKIDTYRS